MPASTASYPNETGAVALPPHGHLTLAELKPGKYVRHWAGTRTGVEVIDRNGELWEQTPGGRWNPETMPTATWAPVENFK